MATKATARNVDFTNVKEGGVYNNKRIESGDYLAKIKQVVDSEVKGGNNKGTPQYEFAIQLVNHPSSVLPYRCALIENQLWKLRNILIAAGKTVPKRKSKVDPNQIVGKLIGVTIDDDEYENKDGKTVETSQVAGVFPAADLGDDVAVGDDTEEDEDEDLDDSPLAEEEDEDEADDEAEDEAEEEEEDDSEAARIAGLNRTQLKAEIIKIQSDFQARKSQSDNDLRDILSKLLSAENDEEEEDEEPTPPPAKKKAAPAKKAPAKRKAKPKAEDIDDEELDELDIDNL